MDDEKQAPARAQGRVGTTAVVQLVIAIGAGFWASRQWMVATADESRTGAGFWGLIALALFCGALGLMNLVLPWLRSAYSEPLHERQRLQRRLRPAGASWEVSRELFVLGLAFFAPVVPLAIMALRMNAAGSDFTLLGSGATLVCLAVSGIMLLLTTSNLYTMIVAGKTVVELDDTPLEGGAVVPIYVSYEPGRLTPRSMQLRVVCRESGSRILLPQRQRRFGSRRVTVLELHSAIICEQAIGDNPIWPWQCMGTLLIPDNATPSSTDNQNSAPITNTNAIDWTIELNIKVAMAPDFTIAFPIKVE